VGSNQHRTRWGPDLPVPDRGQVVPEEPPERRRCGEVWGTECRAWVQPPDYSHGEHPSLGARWARARDPACPPGVLAALAEDPALGVRWEVAGNPACPPGALAALAQDPDERVRGEVAGNPACPSGALQLLVRDPHEDVRTRARAHPNCPPLWRALDQL